MSVLVVLMACSSPDSDDPIFDLQTARSATISHQVLSCVDALGDAYLHVLAQHYAHHLL